MFIIVSVDKNELNVDFKNSIGIRIKTIRTQKGLTQTKFADELCVSRPFISNVERNINIPSKSLIKLISITFNINEDWIKTGVGDIGK